MYELVKCTPHQGVHGWTRFTAYFASPHSELDLSKYVINPNHAPPAYNLYAVINHYGGLGGGHCECGVDSVWYCVGRQVSCVHSETLLPLLYCFV